MGTFSERRRRSDGDGIRGRIEKIEMSLKRGFHMIITVVVSICRRLIGGHVAEASPTITIIWKPGLKENNYFVSHTVFPMILHTLIIRKVNWHNCKGVTDPKVNFKKKKKKKNLKALFTSL